MPEIVITRGSYFADRIRSYRIFIDGNEQGAIRNNESIRLPTTEGEHSIVMKIDFCRSNEITINTGPNGSYIYCGSNINPLLSLIYLFMPHRWIMIRETADKGGRAD